MEPVVCYLLIEDNDVAKRDSPHIYSSPGFDELPPMCFKCLQCVCNCEDGSKQTGQKRSQSDGQIVCVVHGAKKMRIN